MTLVETQSGTAAALHDRPIEGGAARMDVLTVARPAIVLGSTQSASDIDRDAARAAGVAVVRRRSGGGAVLLEPGRHLWVDLTIGRDDDRWCDDVAEAFLWVGASWAAALADVGLAGASVHRGPLRSSPWSRLLCFAGVGPGEVLAADGRKLVGVSQRRTRHAARFQCLVLCAWEPDRLVRLLALGEEEREAAAAALAGAAAAVKVAPDQLVAALRAVLPG